MSLRHPFTSRPTTMASPTSQQPQQINVTDLDLPQLVDVKKQLEEVHIMCSLIYFD